MAGWALVCLAMFYWLIDVKGYTKWAKPFVIYGMNAIAAFVLSGLVGKLLYLIKFAGADGKEITLKTWIYQGFFVPYFAPAQRLADVRDRLQPAHVLCGVGDVEEALVPEGMTP